MSILYWTLGLVLLQRVVELVWARRNAIRLRQLGGVEADAEGYPYFVLLHASWLASLVVFVPAAARPVWPLLGIFALLQLGRLWVIASLGRYWTTRILTLPGAPVVRTGPFRWFRHPNYLLVIAEIAVLPLAFGAVAIAVSFSAVNLLLIVRRIRIEESILAPRRGLPSQSSWPDVIRPSLRPPSSGPAVITLDHRVIPGFTTDKPSQAWPGDGDDQPQLGKPIPTDQPWSHPRG